MSRLINADEVKDLLLGLDSLPWEEQVDELVDAMPTAYDVEAVVRELWKSTNGCGEICIADAVEIVKRGDGMSEKVKEPWDNGICKKCQHFVEDRYCEAYTFASHLAYCEFVSCCEMFEECDAE